MLDIFLLINRYRSNSLVLEGWIFSFDEHLLPLEPENNHMHGCDNQVKMSVV